MIEICPSQYIHVGGDECPKVRWEKCPKCQARIKALGLKSDQSHSKEERLQSFVINHIEKFLNDHGRQIIGWDEILEGGLAPNATVMSWRGEKGGIEAAKQKHDVIMTRNTYLYFNYYQPKDSENAPLGIGGYLKTTMEYDFNGIVDDVDFIPALIPQPGSTSVRNQFQMDASTSTIFLKLVGRTKHLGNFIVYTAGNFRGSGKTFELQNAYLSFLGFTMGYDTGLFMDLAAAPPTIDFQGPDGMTFYRATQLRYEANVMKGLKVGVGVEMPSVDGTPAQDVRIGKQRMPDIPAYVQYSWAKASHIRVGGILRSMTYEDQVNNKAKSLTGWGIQASGTARLGGFQLYGQYTYGRGIAQYLNDISNLNVDIVPLADESGRMQVLPMKGWYAGLQYNFSKRVFASATYSQSRLFTEDCYAHFNETQYKKGQYLVANVFWNVSHNLQVGAEYLLVCAVALAD